MAAGLVVRTPLAWAHRCSPGARRPTGAPGPRRPSGSSTRYGTSLFEQEGRAGREHGRRAHRPRRRRSAGTPLIAWWSSSASPASSSAGSDAPSSPPAPTPTPPVANQDHWHAAYGVYLCDDFAPPITDERDPKGIHTHGDGIIHIHPFVRSSPGKNATLEGVRRHRPA